MSYVLGIVCDLIQLVCWIVVIHCFNRLYREKSNLQYDNKVMYDALLDIKDATTSSESPEIKALKNRAYIAIARIEGECKQ